MSDTAAAEMRAAYKAGKLRAIGISNFYPDRLVDIANFVEIPPIEDTFIIKYTHIIIQEMTVFR